MVFLYGFCFLFCLGMASHRIDTYNHNKETDVIAYKDAKACFIIAFVVLANWGFVYFFKEKTHYSLFVSGLIALFITLKRKNICAEILSGFLSIMALLYTFFPPIWTKANQLKQPQNPCWITPARVLPYKYILHTIQLSSNS